MKAVPSILKGTKEEIIVDNLRKMNYKDEYIDPNSKGYIEKLLENGTTFSVFEDDYLYQHYITYSERKYLDGFRDFLRFLHQ